MHRSWPTQTIAGAAHVAVWMLLAGNAGAQYAVSQLPVLTPSPPTNIVMMIDDSGSMQSAYVPDGFDQYSGTRRFNAGTFNALAYNPAIHYPAPVIITSSGMQQLVSSFTAAPIDGFYSAAGMVNLSTNYQPTASYQPSQSGQSFANPPSSQDLAAIGAAAGSAFYYVYLSTLTSQTGQACGPPSTNSTNDDNCYQIIKVTTSSGPGGTDETGNFANWYSFYRTRHLMIASAAAITMADPVLQGARVTWRALSTCQDMTSGNNCKGWDNQVVDNRIRIFDDTPVGSSGLSQRASFYKWLQRVPADQSTPTRTTWTNIGDYFSSTTLGANSPYGINPNPATGTAPSGEIACARNYNITLTDGQWNSDSGPFFGAADATATTFPDRTTYPPNPTVPIYSNDPNSGTLSDIAFNYWANNLRPDLDPNGTLVAPYYQVTTGANGAIGLPADYWNPQNDPATWPHLVQITIGVGMTSTMTSPGLPWWGNNVATQYSSPGYMNLWNGTIAWPSINNGGKAYDLWHAAINSRGLAFSAESPADLVAALKTSLNRIKVTMSAQSAVAVSATKLGTGTAVYVASYASSDWHGTLKAYGITSTGISTSAIWQTSNSSFASAPTRNILSANTAGSAATASTTGIAFSSSDSTFSGMWQAITTAQNISPTNSAAILAWLRGDTSQELQHGGNWRNRTSVLGDIVDSTPVFAWHENYGYAGLPEGMSASPNYATFLGSKGSGSGGGYQSKGMVYVGANDGMLHGFDANSGTEVFGYVPHNVIPNLPALADPAYAHRFYVDQTPYVGDACVGSGPASCTWKTVLVGTTGAGGQGVFALDVTHPESMGTTKLLWDLDGMGAAGTGSTNTSGDPDLGYPIGKPMVARLNNGDWVAIFGNGYLSGNGCAVLFIVKLFDGTVTRIGTSQTPGTTAGSSCTTSGINASNGLGPVTLSDVDGDMTTDYVYAGDLQGNMWKFDLHTASAVPSGNVVGGQKLFAASAGCLPGAMPSTCQPITSAPALGKALPGMTGTMVYFGTGRMFASGDLSNTQTQSFYAILDQGNGSTVSKGSLVQQTITDSGNTRTISGNAVVAPGWFANLPDTGERMTFSPLLLDGYVVFATQIPTSNSCTASGTGWIMGIPTTSSSLGNNNNFFQSSLGVAGIQAANGMPEGMSVVYDPTTKTDKLIVGETGGPQVVSTQSLHITGRISWHELTR
ncbi:MAG TPA: PilC/PilY family type IV pilus protein [Burkholderiaceae bacterium]|nr:PilC/PilY family type IV pilus protein [Burkholderiaceae bacterium]